MLWAPGMPQLMRKRGRNRARLRIVEPPAPWAQRPRWHQLYVALIVVAALGFAGETLAPSDGWRRLADIATAAAAFGTMALWLRHNRLRLSCQAQLPDDGYRHRAMLHPLREGTSRPAKKTIDAQVG